MLWFIVTICSVVFICFTIPIILDIKDKISNRKIEEFLDNNSISINALKELNAKYSFYKIANFDQTFIYDNINNFEDVSCEDFLIYQLQDIKFDVEKEIKKTNYNKNKFNEYCKEVSKISKFGEYKTKISKSFNKKLLILNEKQIFNRYLLQPKTTLSIHVSLYYSKMNGLIVNDKHNNFSCPQITSYIQRLNNKNRNFYNDREIWNSICRVERSKVSNKMRFEIYKRDGYQCCICWKNESSALLEIDHIKPISKGGKSTYDNLQTLCRQCNKNKGNNY